jgi:hypothetical protein
MAGAVEIRARARIPIPAHPTTDQSPVRFSFKYLDLVSEKFAFERCKNDFLRCLLEELKRLSACNVSEFCEYDNERHSHAITFLDTTEPNGFPGLEDQLEPEYFWQFSLVRNRPWRVHGFFIDSVFYVVWLDPEHRLDGRRNERSAPLD